MRSFKKIIIIILLQFAYERSLLISDYSHAQLTSLCVSSHLNSHAEADHRL